MSARRSRRNERTREVRRIIGSGVIALGLLAAATGVASADQQGDANAFICPVVEEGVLNSPLGAGPYPGGGATFLPAGGNSQGGSHANANGLNGYGTPSATNRPGAVGFTPIWNPPG